MGFLCLVVVNESWPVSYPLFKTRREYVHVALVTASLLSTVLKTGSKTGSVIFTGVGYLIGIL